jgi:hypothetical protein
LGGDLSAAALALTRVTDDEFDTHEMFQTEEARSYLDEQRRIDVGRKTGVAAVRAQSSAEPLVAAE